MNPEDIRRRLRSQGEASHHNLSEELRALKEARKTNPEDSELPGPSSAVHPVIAPARLGRPRTGSLTLHDRPPLAFDSSPIHPERTVTEYSRYQPSPSE